MKDERLSIGKVCKLVGLPQSVLRFWETEFEQLNPHRTPGGTRKYSRNDINVIMSIKDLLYRQKYNISGAKVKLKSGKQPATAKVNYQIELNEIIAELERIIADLKTI